MVPMVPAVPGYHPRTGAHSVAPPGVYFPGAPVPATLRSWVLPMAEVGFALGARVVRVLVGRAAPGGWVGWQAGHRLVVPVAPKCWLPIRQWERRRWAAGWAGRQGWGQPQKRLQERQHRLVWACQARIPALRRVARVRPRCPPGLQARVAQGVRARAPHARPPPDWPIPPLVQRFLGHPRHCQPRRHPVRDSIRALGCRSQSRTLLGWYPPHIALPALARWFPKRHSGLWRCARAR